MNKYTILLFLISTNLVSQKHDYTWLTGYRFREDTIQPAFGVTRLDFNTSSLNPKISYDTFKRIDFIGTNNCVSDYNGQYLFAYNGHLIEDNKNQVIKNGIITNVERADLFRQISIITTHGKNQNKFNMFSLEFDLIGELPGSKYLFKTELENSGKGIEIISKKEIVIEDTLEIGYITAVKHSNGKDWWVFIFKVQNNGYYSILLNGENGNVTDINFRKLSNGYGRTNNAAVINQIGNKLAVISIHNHIDSLKSYLDIFDVDREAGKLTLSKHVVLIDTQPSFQMHGVVFSSNSKYLYVSQIDYIFQIDMDIDSLVFDTVAVYDGFTDFTPDDRPGSVLSHTKFGFLDLAPDGRIYGTTSCCTQRYMYVIDKPNLKGKACDVRQHSVKLTVHKDLPTFPNYRLGPIDGSATDTLGIDNVPVAEFRYDQDTSYYRKIEFTNLSWYEPEEFWWDWGDGTPIYYTNVWDTAITHEYLRDGVYTVCLRAKNSNGENTICKILNIGTTGVNPIDSMSIDIRISPNPCNELLIVQLNNYLPQNMQLNMSSFDGKVILTKRIYEGSNLLDTEPLPAGVYLVNIFERGLLVKSEKLVVLR